MLNPFWLACTDAESVVHCVGIMPSAVGARHHGPRLPEPFQFIERGYFGN